MALYFISWSCLVLTVLSDLSLAKLGFSWFLLVSKVIKMKTTNIFVK